MLDFCDLVGVQPALPDYMSQYTELHRRQPVAERAFSWESGATGQVSALTVSDTATAIYASASDVEDFSTMTVGAIQTVFITKTETGFATSQTSSVSTYLPTATSEPVDPGVQSTGLSTGAKAGIGVAIPLAVIFIASILLCIRMQSTIVAALDVDADVFVDIWRRLKGLLGSSPENERTPQRESDHVDSVTERWRLLAQYQADIPRCSVSHSHLICI